MKKSNLFLAGALSISLLGLSTACIISAKGASKFSQDVLSIAGETLKKNSFFGLAFRTKYIDRWGTLIDHEKESLNDHLIDTSRIAHMLVLIKNKKYGGNLNPDRAATLAMYHDVTEIMTDDMPTPVKYGHPQMKPLYDSIESQANDQLLSCLPEEFRSDFDSILTRKEEEKELWKIVKYADTISAFIKCLREKSLGNKDFNNAYNNLERNLLENGSPEVHYFLKTFLPSFGYTYPENND